MRARHPITLWALAAALGAPAAGLAQDFELPAGDAEAEDYQDEAALPAAEAPAAPATPPPPPPAPAAPPSPPAPTPPPVTADERVLVVVRAEGTELQAFAAALGPRATEALARRLDARGQDITAALDPGAAETARREIDEACGEVEAGIEAFEQLDLEHADEVLRDAVEGLVARLGDLTPKDRRVLAQGLFALSVTVLFNGATDAADELLSALAAIEPGFSPEPGRYPSNVMERFERQRGGLSDDRTTGALWIDSTPPGAEVLVDGGFRGYAPIRIEGLPGGQHAVTLRHPAYLPVGRLMRVAPPGQTGLELALTPGPRTETWSRLTRDVMLDEGAGLRIANRFDTGRVALVWLSGSRLAPVADGLWIDRRSGRVTGRIEARALGEALGVAAARLAVAIAGSTSAPPPKAPPVDESQAALTQQWWFWALVGSVAVGAAAATTGWALSRGGDEGPPRNTAIFRF